ncbi:MAG: fibronectin type III domain-containing protein, partial [Oscillospiraceae bacterium]|nr:fibronectin type III domain-containing protein [Oscillospiraceae bacterium]
MFQEEKGRKLGALLAAAALVVSLVTIPAFAAPSLKPGQGETVIVAEDDGAANADRAPRQVNVHMGDDPSAQVNFTYTTVAESTTQVVIREQGGSESVTLQGTAGVGQGGKFFHAIAVEGLLPDTVYEYTVGYGANVYDGKFQTAPPAGSQRTIKFAYLADTQVSNATNAQSLGATLHEVNQIPNLDFVYIAGDVTDTATSESQWEQLFYNEGAFPNGGQDMFGNNLLAVTQGNHDNNVMHRHINAPAQQGNIVYAFDYGPATFIILNLE